MRLIDADVLIADLEYDIKIDQDSLDYEDLTDINRSLIQFDKDCKQNAIDILNHTPTIEPEQKHGRWVEEHVGNGWNEIWNYTCSECGKTINDFYKANYCPNCGCAMTKDGES